MCASRCSFATGWLCLTVARRSPKAPRRRCAMIRALSPPISEPSGMIEIRDLHVYYGHVHALNAVSLAISRGQIFAVLGANGAGETTLLRGILGLRSTTGSI